MLGSKKHILKRQISHCLHPTAKNASADGVETFRSLTAFKHVFEPLNLNKIIYLFCLLDQLREFFFKRTSLHALPQGPDHLESWLHNQLLLPRGEIPSHTLNLQMILIFINVICCFKTQNLPTLKSHQTSVLKKNLKSTYKRRNWWLVSRLPTPEWEMRAVTLPCFH